MRLWRILLPIRMSIKFGFLVCTSSPPPVASALALVFRESKSTESESVFLLLVLKAPGHSKNSRNSGIPTKVGSIVRSDLGLLVPY